MSDDPHKKHHYSMDMLLQQAFTYELMNVLRFIDDPKYAPAKEVVEVYLKSRVKEIKERWN